MGRFRFKRGVPLPYDVQGYVYFVSRRYGKLPAVKRRQIDELCRKAGGEYAPALKEFVTTNTGAEEICNRYFLSPSTLERIVKRYYLGFAENL